MNMNFEQTAVVGFLILLWNRAKAIFDDISKIAEPVIKEVEKRAVDGLIDRKDRKAIVMAVILEAEKAGKIKLNFLSRAALSFVVDKIANRMPDFKISQEVTGLVTKEQNVIPK